MMFIGQCIHDIAVSYGLIISLFLAGLVGGLTHCSGMCAPFVLAQTGNMSRLKNALLLPYHLGRMTTYVLLAVLMSSLVNLAFIFSDLKAVIVVPMLLLAAVIFLASAFPKLIGLFPWVEHLKITAPYKSITSLSAKLMNDPGTFKRYGLGILLGFMPCGLVVSALLASATASNTFHAALAMGAFAIGTIPALVLVAFTGQALKTKYPKISTRVTQGAMIISSFWLFALAGAMVF